MNRFSNYYQPAEPQSDPLTARDLEWFKDVDESYWSGYGDGARHSLGLTWRSLLLGLLIGWVIGVWW